MADDDEANGITPNNLLGCAIGTLTSLLVGTMAVVALGLSCPAPCQEGLWRSILLAIGIAVPAGILVGWGTARLYRWVARRFDL